jgi:hypothetical protein
MLNFYLYSVSSVSLATFYVATLILISGFLRLVFNVGSDYDNREAIAGGLGFLLVSFPLWMIHWRWLREQFDRQDDRSNILHRFYLFTVVCLNAIAVMIGGSIGATALANLLLSVGGDVPGTWIRAGVSLSATTMSLILWLHHWRQLQSGVDKSVPELSSRHNRVVRT